MAIIFFSYSHLDEALRDRLEKHFAVLKRDGTVETWYDRRLYGGDVLDPTIMAQIERADIILCLVSSDFLASDYCYSTELGRALERHETGAARVIPVILRDCEWKCTPLGKLVALPRDGKPVVKFPHEDEALLQVVEAIRAYVISRGASVEPSDTHVVNTVPSVTRGQQSSLPHSPSGFRSSNLRIRKMFTEADRHRFQEEGFEFIANYFAQSLEELERRNSGLEARFRRIDPNAFTAHAFLDGHLSSQCRVFLGGLRAGDGIAYSGNAAGDHGFNECLNVHADDQALSFKSLGMAYLSGQNQRERTLTQEGAAELYWSLFVEPLQR